MNPWGIIFLGIGVLMLIMGITGSYDKVRSAITGRAVTTTSTNLTAPASSGSEQVT